METLNTPVDGRESSLVLFEAWGGTRDPQKLNAVLDELFWDGRTIDDPLYHDHNIQHLGARVTTTINDRGNWEVQVDHSPFVDFPVKVWELDPDAATPEETIHLFHVVERDGQLTREPQPLGPPGTLYPTVGARFERGRVFSYLRNLHLREKQRDTQDQLVAN